MSAAPRSAASGTLLKAPVAASAAGLDIALAGVPFDLGSYYRTGARQGPADLRAHSWIIRGMNAITGIAPFELCNVGDVGDVPIHPTQFEASIAAIETFFRDIGTHGAAPLAIGGDHTVTLPILRAVAAAAPLGLVHFDAHPDTYDVMDGTRVNVGTPFRRAIEEGLIDPRRYAMIGIRSVGSPEPLEWARAQGVTILTMEDLERLGVEGVLAAVHEVVGGDPAYVTFDVDGLDSVYVPGTASPEPGGLTMREAQRLLRGLGGLALIGGDVVELSPPLDPSGNTTIVAANLLFEILCLLAQSRRRSRARR